MCRGRFHFINRLTHADTDAGLTKHFDIVWTIPDHRDSLCRDLQQISQSYDYGSLVDSKRRDIQKAWFRFRSRNLAAELAKNSSFGFQYQLGFPDHRQLVGVSRDTFGVAFDPRRKA